MPDVFLGIDVGTSGVRALAMDAEGMVLGQGTARMAEFGADGRDPTVWRRATEAALAELSRAVEPSRIVALAVDGTSGTVLPVDGEGRPLARALMYNDKVGDAAILDAVSRSAPAASAAHGPTSGLAKALSFQGAHGAAKILHQADWIAGQFSGCFDRSDANNALKTGYDPVAERWPDWIAETGMRLELLPDILEPGAPVGTVSAEAQEKFGFPDGALVVAGSTDGCASFLATGASLIGEGVTALGSTLTLKLLSDRPIFAPQYGIYSHRVLGSWLAGGASNTGGAVLAHFFEAEEIAEFSKRIDAEKPTGLDFYPLLSPGERFPVSDPALPPCLEPRPAEPGKFLQALLEGIAAIEALGYRRLEELGAPRLENIRTVGGGAKNTAWQAIRRKRLGVPLLSPASEEAAAGAARLALVGAKQAGLL
ncbi:MAG TPA: FGGY-family carbohydrate kinase [Mesorhizobium sp.]|jgi:hypothetical protein|nr:FGGY-family carbohydrate kinase [Mesorhizobium sp.]